MDLCRRPLLEVSKWNKGPPSNQSDCTICDKHFLKYGEKQKKIQPYENNYTRKLLNM